MSVCALGATYVGMIDRVNYNIVQALYVSMEHLARIQGTEPIGFDGLLNIYPRVPI